MSEFQPNDANVAALVSAAAQRGFGYTGAGTTSPALRNWNPAAGSPNYDTLSDLQTLRARSRDAHRNHPIAIGSTDTKVTHVVGTGLRPKPQIDREFLGLSDEEAMAWEAAAARIFSLHCDRLDIEGELSFAELQQLSFRSILESGDLLGVRRYRQRRGDLLATRIQIVEADRISNPHFGPDTRTLAAGIETDRDGRTVAYHVADSHPGEILLKPISWERVLARGRAGRRAKLFFFKSRPGQRRGIPDLAPMLERLKQLTRLSESELAAAVVSSFFTVFIKQAQAVDGDIPSLDGYLTADGESSENVDAAGRPVADERELHLGNGTIIELDDGEEISTASPGRPNDAFAPFWEAIVREIGMSVGLPYEVLIKHFQASYSASRAAFLIAWKYFFGKRGWLGGGFCQMAYEWTISEAIARELLPAPGFFENPLVRRAYLDARWIGDAPGQIDPLKETKAAREKVDGGLSTEEEEMLALSGADWARQQPQRKREAAARTELRPAPPVRSTDEELVEDEEDGDTDDESRRSAA